MITRRVSYMIASLVMTFSTTIIIAFAKPDWPIDAGVQLEAGIVIDMDSGAMLFAQGIYEQEIPANIIRLLIALVVIKNTNGLDAPVTFSHDAIYNVESGAGNRFNLGEGDVLSIRQCLYVVLLRLSSRSANALAEYVAGSRRAFMDMMSQRIEEFGCNESHFVNPSGLNGDTQRAAAYDMAVVTRVCFQSLTVLEIASVRTSSMPATASNPNGRTSSTEHRALLLDDSNYYLGATVGKVGWTSQARRTLIAYAGREGRGQIAATLVSIQKAHYSDTKIILDFYFTKFKNVNIVDNGTEYAIDSAPVTIGAETYSPSEPSIDSGAIITISNDAQSMGVDKTPEADSPESHPQGAVAKLVYTYNKCRAGNVWIYSSSAQAVNAIPSEPGGDTPPESQPAEGGQEGNTGFTLPRAVLVGDGAILVLALFAGGGVFWFKRRQTAEQERQRILKEERRQRLTDMGYTKEDFGCLLDEWRKQHDMR